MTICGRINYQFFENVGLSCSKIPTNWILSINIDEEKQAIAEYTELLKNIPKDNVILYKTIEDIIRDEQEHLEELENFL